MFQSTHPHGVRPSRMTQAIRTVMFQSTHPHGVRLLFLTSTGGLLKFQSTHPHGVRRRDASRTTSCNSQVSIHAPTRGATKLESMKENNNTPRFNPRTHTGCDLTISKAFMRIAVSIHAPTRGATHLFFFCQSNQSGFQSTHPHGVRPTCK